MRLHGIKYVYCDSLVSPRVASVLAREAGAGILSLNAAHNLTKENMDEGATFISIMEKNLAQLKRGLECQ
jgi:zinc transport system substrate-binding protein